MFYAVDSSAASLSEALLDEVQFRWICDQLCNLLKLLLQCHLLHEGQPEYEFMSLQALVQVLPETKRDAVYQTLVASVKDPTRTVKILLGAFEEASHAEWQWTRTHAGRALYELVDFAMLMIAKPAMPSQNYPTSLFISGANALWRALSIKL